MQRTRFSWHSYSLYYRVKDQKPAVEAITIVKDARTMLPSKPEIIYPVLRFIIKNILSAFRQTRANEKKKKAINNLICKVKNQLSPKRKKKKKKTSVCSLWPTERFRPQRVKLKKKNIIFWFINNIIKKKNRYKLYINFIKFSPKFTQIALVITVLLLTLKFDTNESHKRRVTWPPLTNRFLLNICQIKECNVSNYIRYVEQCVTTKSMTCNWCKKKKIQKGASDIQKEKKNPPMYMRGTVFFFF